MNGRITDSPTPSRRLTALAISVLWSKFEEFRSKQSTSREVLSTAVLQHFLDYADLQGYMEICFEKEELMIRIDEGAMVQDRYRKQALREKLKEATRRVHDVKIGL